MEEGWTVSETVTLESLRGLRMLDARGEFVSAEPADDWRDRDARVVILRLDGTLYWFQEDPDDGYRSSMSHVRIADARDLPDGCLATFEPRLVNCELRTKPEDEHSWISRDEVLFGIDEATGMVLFEIGTENLDDYYPYFVSRWTPPDALASQSKESA